MSNVTHKYHLVDPSPLPILGTISLFILACGALGFMHDKAGGLYLMGAGFVAVIALMISWWSKVIKEGREDKAHTDIVKRGLSWGMLLFIISEVMFFFGFFMSFFEAALTPVDLLEGVWPAAQGIWPPKGIVTFDAWHLPFLNTVILLISSFTADIAHHAVIEGNQKKGAKWLFITVVLGITFTICQAYEYHHAAFGFTQGVYASNFYLATGFHGFHVIVGTLFLIVCLKRALSNNLPQNGHLGLDFACWYWHFVDVVWIFLFSWVYVWGG